ncbi:MAG: hypothetical protein Q8P76_04185 [bacterium]|nr:hypothetical protein [bacterium]
MLTKREGLMLYWCEGDKTFNRVYMVAVTSTDYWIIKNFMAWLDKFYKISANKIKLRLHLWPDSNENIAKKYWSDKLSVPLSQFTKTYIKKSAGKNNKYKHGVCRAGVYSKTILSNILKDIEFNFTKE